MKRVLTVGGSIPSTPLPSQYADFKQQRLGSDPKGEHDIVCDARSLTTLEAGQFDAVYCSHDLEHYHRHEVPQVLAGFMHLLKDGGFAQIRVPDLQEVMRLVASRGLDVEDVLVQSPRGPLTALDLIYGNGEKAAHTGFTQKSLVKTLRDAGFDTVYAGVGNLEVSALAFKGDPDDVTRRLFKLPNA